MVVWYVVDIFGMEWSDIYDTLAEAQAALRELREDPIVKQWDIELEIQWRRV